MREWLKIMLGEIDRKREEAREHEAERRESGRLPARPGDKPATDQPDDESK